jgi:glycosyltransferase involved in cell wall biosynthesis
MSNNLKRYLFVSHGSSLHGAELCLLESVIAFKKLECCEVIAIVPGQKGSKLENLLIQNGAMVLAGIDNPRWVDHSFSLGSFIWRTLKTLVKALRLLVRYKPDYVVINSIVVSPVFALASRFLRIKTVWFIHELGDVDHGFHYLLGKSTTFKILKLLSNQQVFNSLYTAHHFGGTRQNCVVRNPVTENIPPLASVSPLHNVRLTANWHIVLIGRTEEGKAQSQIIEAANLLLHKYCIANFRVSIVGVSDCGYSRGLFSLAQEYKILDHIEFIPFGENVMQFLSSADIGVTTSLNESFGRITVEYLKSGLVTIGASSGGTKEILDEFKGAYQYESGNAADLADRLCFVFNSDLQATALQCSLNALHARKLYNLENHYSCLREALCNRYL